MIAAHGPAAHHRHPLWITSLRTKATNASSGIARIGSLYVGTAMIAANNGRSAERDFTQNPIRCFEVLQVLEKRAKECLGVRKVDDWECSRQAHHS